MISKIASLFAHLDPVQETSTKKEEAWFEQFVMGRLSKFESYNPDELTQRKGFKIYKKMLLDPQVKSAFDLVSDIIASRPYRFSIVSDNTNQEEIKEFFEFNLNSSLHGTFSQALKTVLTAKAYGYSVSEKTYSTVKFNNTDKWCLSAIKPKPFDSFTFEQDVFGNVVSIIQEQAGNKKKLNPNKFILYVNDPECHPIYGQSDLQAVYKPYWSKQNIEKMWNIYIERTAGGFVMAKATQSGALSPSERSSFEKILSNLQAGTSMRVPFGYDVDIVQPSNNDAFERALMYYDKQIAKALLVPNLLGFSEQGGLGSNAQAQTQLETFLQLVNLQANTLADVLNEQLFKQLAVWNFGAMEYPHLEFESMTSQEKERIATVWMEAVSKGTVTNTFNDENRTRELLQYDPISEDDIEKPEPKSEPPQSDPEPVEEEPADETPEEMTEHFAEGSPWEQRIDFNAVEDELTELDMKFYSELSVAVDAAFDDTVKTVEEFNANIQRAKQDIPIDQIMERLDSAVTPEVKRFMRETIKTGLSEAYQTGRRTAEETIEKGIKETPVDKEMKESLLIRLKASPEMAVKMKRGQEDDYSWTIRHFVEGIDLTTAIKYFEARSFWITGVITEQMTEAARQVLIQGMRDELTLDEMIEELKQIVSPLIGKIDPETGEPDTQERARLETIVRTNTTDSFNQAQLAVYNSPDMGNFVDGLEYSAIMDNRTTPVCRAYNTRKFPRTDPIWGSISPPNHFSCRSVTIPIMIFDEWRPDKKPIDPKTGQVFQPSEGFGKRVPLKRE